MYPALGAKDRSGGSWQSQAGFALRRSPPSPLGFTWKITDRTQLLILVSYLTLLALVLNSVDWTQREALLALRMSVGTRLLCSFLSHLQRTFSKPCYPWPYLGTRVLNIFSSTLGSVPAETIGCQGVCKHPWTPTLICVVGTLHCTYPSPNVYWSFWTIGQHGIFFSTTFSGWRWLHQSWGHL